MDYKKKYEQAIENFKKIKAANKDNNELVDFIEYEYPELKENMDEKIRKELIKLMKQMSNTIVENYTTIEISTFVAWLEKQGETKPYSWEPTKEQLEALDYAYNSCPDTERGNYYEGVLETLIDDLHKLSEKQGENKCPFLKDDCTCNIYEYRPDVCRKFGQIPQLPCKYIKP